MVTTLAIPVAWFAIPHLLHLHLIGKLTASDTNHRERGLNYVIRRANERPKVLQDAIEKLTVPSDGNFLQIASALQQAGCWRYPIIPAEPWLRWIEILGRDTDPEARILAAQQLAELKEIHADPRVPQLVARWMAEDNADVRLNALIVAAEIAGQQPQPNSYDTMVLTATGDAAPLVAREACLLARVLNLPAERCIYPDIAPLDAPDGEPLTEKTLERAFESDYPFVRDRACIFAATQFDDDRNATLIRHLLYSFSDNAKRSGAVLAGLTGLQPKMLRRKMDDEDIWAVQQAHRLGMWMQGQLPEMDNQAPLLLARPDLPSSTILLALLHHDRKEGLNLVLTPRTDEIELSPESLNLPTEESDQPISLARLLTRYQWWDVLSHFLPPTAPTIILPVDDKAVQYQVDLLRNWWLVHRHDAKT